MRVSMTMVVASATLYAGASASIHSCLRPGPDGDPGDSGDRWSRAESTATPGEKSPP
jgi:hypothetical protein